MDCAFNITNGSCSCGQVVQVDTGITFSCLETPDYVTPPSECVAEVKSNLGSGFLTAVNEFVLGGSSFLRISDDPYAPSHTYENNNAPCYVSIEPQEYPTIITFEPDATNNPSKFTLCYHNRYENLPCASPATSAPEWPILDFIYTWYYWLPAISVVLFVILCTLTGIRRRRAMLARLRAQRQRLLVANDAVDSAEVTVSYVAPQQPYPTPTPAGDAKPELATATYAVISSGTTEAPLPVAAPVTVNDIDSALLDN